MKVISEIIISGIILLVSCFLFYVTSTYPQSRMADQVGPALWPKIIIVVIIVLSVTQLIQFVIHFLKAKKEKPKEDIVSEKEGFRMLILTIILSLLYGFGVSYVGFLLSILIFQTLFLLILKVKKISVLILYPFCLTIVIYAIFIKILYIPLPRGTGIFLTISRLFY
jgi:putative tricarboxylic transport membrane protein